MTTIDLQHTTDDLVRSARRALERCGVDLAIGDGPTVTARTPVTGEDLFAVPAVDGDGMEAAIGRAH
ncbi:MAG: hypothetical protein ABWZ13_09920, partial [Acidimicrobiales bacterium]